MKIELFNSRDYSDKDIVSAISNHSEKMAQFLYRKCHSYFCGNYKAAFIMVNEELKDEIFQECFVKLWTDIETGRIHIGEDGTVWRINKKGEDKPMTARLHTFILDIAKYTYKAWMRDNHDESLLDDVFSCDDGNGPEGRSWEEKVSTCDSAWDNTENIVTGQSDYFEQALSSGDQRGLIQEIVQESIMNLSATCREILTMFYYEDLSLDEIILKRGENASKDGLKTGKYKCMKRFEADVRQKFQKYSVRY